MKIITTSNVASFFHLSIISQHNPLSTLIHLSHCDSSLKRITPQSTLVSCMCSHSQEATSISTLLWTVEKRRNFNGGTFNIVMNCNLNFMTYWTLQFEQWGPSYIQFFSKFTVLLHQQNIIGKSVFSYSHFVMTLSTLLTILEHENCPELYRERERICIFVGTPKNVIR